MVRVRQEGVMIRVPTLYMLDSKGVMRNVPTSVIMVHVR